MSSIGTKFILAQRYVFDPNNNSLVDKIENSEVTRLGSNESRILLLLSERPNQVISRDELHEFVWRDQGFQVDDSSLTQAISTLRKLLNDSTKSPQFVKTVPKRGYQFIASVETSIPLSSGDNNIENELIDNENVNEFNNADDQATELEQQPVTSSSPQLEGKTTALQRFYIRLTLLIAVILPIVVLLVIDPNPSTFRLVETVNGIPVKTTENHPPLDKWQPLIRSCVDAYISSNQLKPIEVIATAGPRSNFILNYVYSEANTNENITIQLVADQKEIAKLCQ